MEKIEVINEKSNWTIQQVHILRLVQRDKHRHPQIPTHNHWHTHSPNTGETDGHIVSKLQETKANIFLLIAQE